MFTISKYEYYNIRLIYRIHILIHILTHIIKYFDNIFDYCLNKLSINII